MSPIARTARCAAAVLALTGLPLQARPQDRTNRPERDVITVTGTGETQSSPDIAYVTVGVLTDAKRAQDAAQENAALTEKVMQALRQQDIPDNDLQTSNYSVQPYYGEAKGRPSPPIVGYQVSNQVRATVRRLNTVGRVIDAALAAGANNVLSVFFGLEKRSKAEQEASARAVENARARAEAMARAARVRIAGVVRIEEPPAFRPVPMMAGARFMAAEAAQTPISPGELTISATVTVTFSIAPAKRG